MCESRRLLQRAERFFNHALFANGNNAVCSVRVKITSETVTGVGLAPVRRAIELSYIVTVVLFFPACVLMSL